MNDRGTVASYLMSPSSEITNRERNSQFKLMKDLSSNRVNDLLKNKTVPYTLYNNLLGFRKTDKKFDLNEEQLKMITKKKYKVDLATLLDKKNNV